MMTLVLILIIVVPPVLYALTWLDQPARNSEKKSFAEKAPVPKERRKI